MKYEIKSLTTEKENGQKYLIAEIREQITTKEIRMRIKYACAAGLFSATKSFRNAAENECAEMLNFQAESFFNGKVLRFKSEWFCYSQGFSEFNISLYTGEKSEKLEMLFSLPDALVWERISFARQVQDEGK
ncbi:hypothetical protein JYT23_01135 [Mariprofundus ferrooxydans]|nr:hypothetical protein [Mariprofundus ferrooxydans]